MNYILRFLLFAALGILIQSRTHAQDSIPIQNLLPGYESWELDSTLLVWVDSSQSLDVEEAYSLKSSFFPYKQLPDSLPLSVDLWGILRLHNPQNDSLKLIWDTYTSDMVDLYIFDQGKIVENKTNGIFRRVKERDVKMGAGGALTIQIAPFQQIDVLIKKRELRGEGPDIRPSIQLSRRFYNRFLSSTFGQSVLISGFICILAIIFLYNIIIFFSIRESTYLFYALYLFSIGITIYLENVTRNFPSSGFDNVYWNGVLGFVFFGSTSIWYILFGRQFISSKTLTPKWDKGLLGLMWLKGAYLFIGVVIILIKYFLGEQWPVTGPFFTVLLILMGVETLFMIAYFFPLLKSGSVIARFFVAGSALLFVLGFVSLALQNFLQLNTFLYFLGGIILEILIFSLGLGYRVRKNQEDKLKAEKALNQELSKVNSAFGRFVPHEFLQSLGLDSVTQAQLGDQVEKEVTVFFSDIRGYTGLSESMTPKDNFRFLNAYLGRVGPIIKDQKGFVNQYFGDGIMALFMGKSSDSIRAAIQIQQALRAYNIERNAKGRVPISIGIGLHTGPLMMGIIGDQLRMDATVVADTVNTASRMEGLTKYYGADLILSETVVRGLEEDHPFTLRYLGKVLVKGRRQPLGIYEGLDACASSVKTYKLQTQEPFEQGLNSYLNKDFAAACREFEEVLTIDPGDKAASYYFEKSKNYLMVGVEENWNGVETMMSK